MPPVPRKRGSATSRDRAEHAKPKTVNVYQHPVPMINGTLVGIVKVGGVRPRE